MDNIFIQKFDNEFIKRRIFIKQSLLQLQIGPFITTIFQIVKHGKNSSIWMSYKTEFKIVFKFFLGGLSINMITTMISRKAFMG